MTSRSTRFSKGLAVFAAVLPARASTGVLLPVLIAGDVLAVLTYRRHAHWPTLWRPFPAVAAGVEWLLVEQDEAEGSTIDAAERSFAALAGMLGVAA